MNPQSALGNLQSYKPENASDTLRKAQNWMDVGYTGDQMSSLKNAIHGTQGLLEQVAPSVMGRISNSLVTNAKANAQIGQESAPIRENLTNLGGAYNQAGQDYNWANSLANNQAQQGIQFGQNQESYLQKIYNDLFKRDQNAKDQAQFEQGLARLNAS